MLIHITYLSMKMSVQDLKKRSKTWKKFIFVREPMERLASCYNDKILVDPQKHYSPSHVIHFRNKVKKKALAIKGKENNSSSKASFDDFLLAAVIPGRERATDYGQHWGPYYKICSPCTVNYDYIGLLDPTMEETKVSDHSIFQFGKTVSLTKFIFTVHVGCSWD